MNKDIKEKLEKLRIYAGREENSFICDIEEYITSLQEENIKLNEENISIKSVKYMISDVIHKSIIDKAIDYIIYELIPYGDEWHWDDTSIRDYVLDLLNILKGVEDE